MGALVSRGTVVLARRFTASGYADLAIRHGATVGSLFASPIRMILGQQPRPHWREHSLRVVAYAQNLTRAEHEAWDKILGAPLLQLYGMTETIGPPVMNSLVGPHRHDAIGRPVLGYTCRIVRRDALPQALGSRASWRSAAFPECRSWPAI
jgi:crotonobetaine/carnitine-CoA ligase